MENAKSAIKQSLAEVKAFLAQESPPRLSEADTKAYFVEPLIKALGWEGLGNVTREYYVRNSQEFIDYVLRAPAGGLTSPSINLIAIETKAIQHELSDKHAAQLVQYCAVDGIEWAVLTNGRELELFNTFLRPDLDSKRVLRLDLLAFNSDEEFEAMFAQLWQLSRENMIASKGVRTWMNQQLLDRLVRRLLTTPGSLPIQALEQALAEADIQGTGQDLVQWFRMHLGGGMLTRLNHVSEPVPPSVGRVEAGIPGASESTAPAPINIRSLVSAGVLPAGTRLNLMRGGEVIAQAHVDREGQIMFEGRAYRSPSDKAFATLLGNKALNGWMVWWAELPDGTVVLNELRNHVRSQLQDKLASGS